METKQRGMSKQFQYTGERLRQFLQHNGISYKEAASILSIDKNTVGKAVRGGNLNVDILLHICNVFQMDVTDFFCCEITDKDGLPRNYYISSELIKDASGYVSEEMFNYKKSKNLQIVPPATNEAIEEVDHMLSSLEKAYSECREKLETILKEAIRTKAESDSTLK